MMHSQTLRTNQQLFKLKVWLRCRNTLASENFGLGEFGMLFL